MTAVCTECGQTWPRHPALEVPCPDCHQPAGRWCKRPSNHKAGNVHRSREALAVERGFLTRECPAPRNS
jgi:hypothetical protein